MSAIRAQSYAEDRASGAQVIDGSVYFNEDKGSYLTRTPSSAGNRKTWTWSCWCKIAKLPVSGTNGDRSLFSAVDAVTDGDDDSIRLLRTGTTGANSLSFSSSEYNVGTEEWIYTNALLRDPEAFYHIVVAKDTTQSSLANGQLRMYINGVQQSVVESDAIAQNAQRAINSTVPHAIGDHYGQNRQWDGLMSQVYFIDGQALDASSFGYTDPLTNTWRPKKFTGDYQSNGVNTFTSGTGGYPILNTNGNGTATASGYRTDKNPSGTDVSSYLSLAIPGSGGSIADVSADVKGSGSNKSISADNGDPSTSTTESNWYGKSVHLDGDDSFTCGSGSDYAVGTSDFTAEGWFWFNSSGSSQCLMEWDNNSSASGSPSGRSDGGQWYYSSGGNKLHWYQNSSSFATGTTITAQEWTHLAVVVTGGTMKFYKNGTESASSSYSLDLGNTDGNLRIGLQGGTFFNGYINDFRFYKGVAKYTSAFTPAPNTGGINSFHLPLDGSAPIGSDQSGLGNDFTPVNLTSSASLEKATSALPILNTSSGGNVAVPGVRGQAGIAVTVYNPTGSQNRYYFDGVEAPSYNFARGQTVTFDLGDSTVATHQLKFSTTSDGTHGGGSAYDDGAAYGAISAGTVGAATTITFPHNAENTLYYYCINHSGMGGSVGLTTDVQKADLYAWKNVLAVAFDGGSSDYSDLINTGSPKKSITENTSSGETMEYRNFYLSSYKFDGSNDVVYTADSTDFTMGSGDWTIECWIRRRRVDTDEWFLTQSDGTSANTSFGLHIDASTNYLEGRARSDSSGAVDFAGTTPMQTGLWYHCALVRDGSTLRLFLNGNQESTNAIAGTLIDSSAPLCMGALTDAGSAATSCYMQDVRVYKGIAKYTKSFIPASTWNSIGPDTPSGVSYGSELTPPTAGSVSFSGTNNALYTTTSSSDFTMAGDFTIECWVYPNDNSTSANDGIFQFSTTSGGLVGSVSNMISMQWESISSGPCRFNVGFMGSWENSTIDRASPKRWYHIALVRSSGTVTSYVNGVEDQSFSNSDTLSLTYGAVGGYWSSSNLFDGNISNFRFVNGTALYTQTFTPSNKPLTTTSQGATSSEVKLLCCQSQNSATAAAASPDGAVVGYSGYVSGGLVPGSANQYVPSNCFDGDITTTHVRHKTTPGEEGRVGWHFNPPGGIAYSSLEIHSGVSGVGSQEYILNGGSATAFAENTWVEIDSSSGTLTSLQITEGSTGNNNIYLGAIRINGSTILTDTLYNEGTGAVIPDSQPSEFNPFDTNIDMVMGKSGNYATLNPLSKNSNVSLTDGNLSMSISSDGHYSSIATLGMTTGKYYWEVDSGTGWTNDPAWGIVGEESEHYDDQVNSVPGAWVRNNGRRYYDGTEGDVWMEVNAMNADEGSTLGLAYDGIRGSLQVWINGRYQGVAFTGLKNGMTRNLGSVTSDKWYPVLKMYNGGPVHINFGQQPFKYPCPHGFGPLCSGNLEKPQFVRSNSVVGVSTWRGTSADNHFIPSGFQADLLWTKDRDTSANWYCIDSVRGRTQILHQNLNNAESGPENNIIRSLTNTNGYVLGQGGDANNSSYNYVGYSWKAGGNAGTFNKDGVDAGSAAAAGVSDGSITPTACSVGTREGFSIIKYTSTGSNATVGHGLNATPQLIIVKNTDNNNNWHVYHEALGNTKFLYLDLDYAADTGSGAWNDTSPTSTVFSLGTGNGTNSSSNHEYMAYCWCNKPGLQKFGSYTGNADSGGDGPYVELGFRPALVWFKATTGTQPWNLFDSERGTINPIDEGLLINTTGSEFTGTARVDYLSNGFKVRAPSGGNPNVATTYIYCAWAETPFHNLYGATGTAR